MEFLNATGDARDRSAEIETCLCKTGVCILGPGDFTVTGIAMPPRSRLAGQGPATRLILADEVQEGYTVRLEDRCSVAEMMLLGTLGETKKPEEPGTRHGIGLIGDSAVRAPGKRITHCILHGLHIEGFSGGGVTCLDTGFPCEASMSASDLRIRHCGAGINIAHFSEYHRFHGVSCVRNLYGCINNGGNNVFAACSFDGNTVGFLIDNREGKSVNNSHGSVSACTFNHSDNNKGVGIMVLGAQHGYTFSACQLFYSKVVIEDSYGIQITDLTGGHSEEFRVKGGGLVRIAGANFVKPPKKKIAEDARVVWESNYLRSGDVLTLADLPEAEE